MVIVYHYESDNKHMQSLCLYHMGLAVVCDQSQIVKLTPSDIKKYFDQRNTAIISRVLTNIANTGFYSCLEDN